MTSRVVANGDGDASMTRWQWFPRQRRKVRALDEVDVDFEDPDGIEIPNFAHLMIVPFFSQGDLHGIVQLFVARMLHSCENGFLLFSTDFEPSKLIFFQGCEASVLIDSHGNNIAEKEAPPNLSLRGFEIIDEIKAELEKRCPGIVSCADILALATRDGVALSGGAAYGLPTGRRDGTVSSITEAILPDPASSVDTVLTAFQSKNLNLSDLVTLLGAHSVGFCHCLFFIDRLYSFQGTGFPDPDMDSAMLDTLQKKCPFPTSPIVNISSDPNVFINQETNTPFLLDNSFYQAVLNGRAVLQLDQELAFTSVTNDMLVRFANNPKAFRRSFSKAMIKLGNVGVLSGQDGEIRQNCRRVNKIHG
ncbi:peroxidase 57-like [Magnolia sinica]|uniref:peroxidase 57-like n=1 Tax=Magnolia sinica TaxID=86752 RepID=UPI002659A668|nr:peroxidase 57-like [Magnolia sinica]